MSGYSLPLAGPQLEQAVNQFRREMLIPADDMAWLVKIDDSANHELSSQEALSTFARFLDGGLVLNYRNGEDWYGVNPLLRPLLDKQRADKHKTKNAGKE